MIVLYGAEFTREFANKHTGKVPASEIARKEKP
jgi:hypothetical protein